MLTREENELITDTNPGSPMGELFRRFWLPVALAEELAGPDSAPVRVKIMGEELIAFRDSENRVGLIDAYCAHRGAPLFFGRNVESGLRCVYHGWKYDVTGRCVDLPNAPEGDAFKQKIMLTAYPCVEAGRVIWAYMGPPEKQPPFPRFEWCDLPDSHLHVTKLQFECNYLQAQEGGIDQSHVRFLHSNLGDNPRPSGNRAGTMDPDEPFPREVGWRRVKSARLFPGPAGDPRISEDDAAWFGLGAAQQPDGRFKAVVRQVRIFPCFDNVGVARPGHHHVNFRIPINDTSCFLYRVNWSFDALTPQDLHEYTQDEWYNPPLIPGSYKPADNISNNYNIDRLKQRLFNYTGLKNPATEDQAMIEHQWGPIADRTKEHLTSMDDRIIYLRQRLLRAAKALAAGTEPSEPWHPEAYSFHDADVEADSEEEAIAHVISQARTNRVIMGAQKLATKITV